MQHFNSKTLIKEVTSETWKFNMGYAVSRDSAEWILQAQDRVERWTFVMTVMKYWVQKSARNFFTNRDK